MIQIHSAFYFIRFSLFNSGENSTIILVNYVHILTIY